MYLKKTGILNFYFFTQGKKYFRKLKKKNSSPRSVWTNIEYSYPFLSLFQHRINARERSALAKRIVPGRGNSKSAPAAPSNPGVYMRGNGFTPRKLSCARTRGGRLSLLPACVWFVSIVVDWLWVMPYWPFRYDLAAFVLRVFVVENYRISSFLEYYMLNVMIRGIIIMLKLMLCVNIIFNFFSYKWMVFGKILWNRESIFHCVHGHFKSLKVQSWILHKCVIQGDLAPKICWKSASIYLSFTKKYFHGYATTKI